VRDGTPRGQGLGYLQRTRKNGIARPAVFVIGSNRVVRYVDHGIEKRIGLPKERAFERLVPLTRCFQNFIELRFAVQIV